MNLTVLDERLAAVAFVAAALFAGSGLVVGAALVRRFLNFRSDRLRVAVQTTWTPLLLACASGETPSGARIRRREREFVVLVWTELRRNLRGSAAGLLDRCAYDLGIRAASVKLARSRSISGRLVGVSALGEMRDRFSWSTIENYVDSRDTRLSVAAATALVQIREDRGLAILVSRLDSRADWHPTAVGPALKGVNPDVGSKVMPGLVEGLSERAILTILKVATSATSRWLLGSARTIPSRHTDPAVLVWLLKFFAACRDPVDLPFVRRLASHSDPLVRAEALRSLGLMGLISDVPVVLAGLLDHHRQAQFAAADALLRIPGAPDPGPLMGTLPERSAAVLTHVVALKS